MTKRIVIFFLLVLFSFSFFIKEAQAVISFSVAAPTETLVQGQEFDFTVSINTWGESVSTVQSKITYDSVSLQFVSITNGNFFSQITNTTPSAGTFNVTGTSASPKVGSGTFAVIRFRIIATSSGEAELCSASLVSVTPTPTTPPNGPTPTTPPTAPTIPVAKQCNLACSIDSDCISGLACIGGMCLKAACPTQTNCICPGVIQPTRPPVRQIQKTGSVFTWQVGSAVAFLLIIAGVVGMIIL